MWWRVVLTLYLELLLLKWVWTLAPQLGKWRAIWSVTITTKSFEGSSNVLFFDFLWHCHLILYVKGNAPYACQRKYMCSGRYPRARGNMLGLNVGCESKVKPWGEVFDPNSTCWSPLPKPPSQIWQVDFSFFNYVVIGDKILLCYSGTLFSFDMKTNHREILTSTHPL